MDIHTLKILESAIRSPDILFSPEDTPDKQFMVRFTTQQDNRVDDFICLPLSGNEYRIDDPDRPIIPEGTHPNCRCYYVHVQTGEIVTDISSERTYEEIEEVDPLSLKPKKENRFEQIFHYVRRIFTDPLGLGD